MSFRLLKHKSCDDNDDNNKNNKNDNFTVTHASLFCPLLAVFFFFLYSRTHQCQCLQYAYEDEPDQKTSC